MLLAGDETGAQTQRGNNNAYCQDNETTWLAWDKADQDLITAVSDVFRFRKELQLAAAAFAQGDAGEGDAAVARWLHPRGTVMAEGDWQDQGLTCLVLELARPNLPVLLFCFNAGDDLQLQLPDGGWVKRIDTSVTPVRLNEPVEGTVALNWQSVSVFEAA